MKLELASDPQLMCVVRSAVEQFAAVAGFSEADCRAIVLAVDEALTNVIRHAYGNRHDQSIVVAFQRLGGGPEASEKDRAGLAIEIVDRGKSADPGALRGRALEDVRPGGLGTHLIAQTMDEVCYEPQADHNRLRLVKYVSSKMGGGE